MKFEALKQTLKTNVENCYLITGSDLFLKQKAVELIKTAVVDGSEQLNALYFSTDNVEPSKVIDACNTMPFFASKKLVVIKEYEKQKSDQLIKKLEEYVKNVNTSTCLVLAAEEGSIYFNSLKKYVKVVDCNPLNNDLLSKIIEADVKKAGKKINLIARSLLIDYCSSNLSRISSELKKLLFLLEEEDTITVEMVKENVSKDLEFEIYELTNELARKNTKEVYLYLNKLLDNKSTVSSLFGLIYRHFRRLFYIAVSSNMSRSELADKLKVKEFAIKKMSEQVKAFGASKLKKINELSCELDYKTKTGKYKPEEAIFYFVLNILNM